MVAASLISFWKKVGFTLPSSHFLASRLVANVDWNRCDHAHIIELGAGTGVVTREIIRHMPKTCRLSVFEIDPVMVDRLKEEFAHLPNVTVSSQSAAHIDTIFDEETIDLVISTLPLGSISREGVDHILQSVRRVLRTGAQFIQYQYWMANRDQVKQYFHLEKTSLELRNLGPAFIYRTRKNPN